MRSSISDAVCCDMAGKFHFAGNTIEHVMQPMMQNNSNNQGNAEAVNVFEKMPQLEQNSEEGKSYTLGDSDTDSDQVSSVNPSSTNEEPNMETQPDVVKSFPRACEKLQKVFFAQELNMEVQLDAKDYRPAGVPWSYCLVGYVVGRFPGKHALLHCCKEWGVKFRYALHESNWLVFSFKNKEDRKMVLDNGPYFVYNRPLILKILPPFFDFKNEELFHVPVWVKIRKLPLELWSSAAISKILSLIGNPLKMDNRTAECSAVSYARALVEINVTKTLVNEINVRLADNSLLNLVLHYENVPHYCKTCFFIGHRTEKCGVKKSVKNSNWKQGKKQGNNAAMFITKGAKHENSAHLQAQSKGVQINHAGSLGLKSTMGRSTQIQFHPQFHPQTEFKNAAERTHKTSNGRKEITVQVTKGHAQMENYSSRCFPESVQQILQASNKSGTAEAIKAQSGNLVGQKRTSPKGNNSKPHWDEGVNLQNSGAATKFQNQTVNLDSDHTDSDSENSTDFALQPVNPSTKDKSDAMLPAPDQIPDSDIPKYSNQLITVNKNQLLKSDAQLDSRCSDMVVDDCNMQNLKYVSTMDSISDAGSDSDMDDSTCRNECQNFKSNELQEAETEGDLCDCQVPKSVNGNCSTKHTYHGTGTFNADQEIMKKNNPAVRQSTKSGHQVQRNCRIGSSIAGLDIVANQIAADNQIAARENAGPATATIYAMGKSNCMSPILQMEIEADATRNTKADCKMQKSATAKQYNQHTTVAADSLKKKSVTSAYAECVSAMGKSKCNSPMQQNPSNPSVQQLLPKDLTKSGSVSSQNEVTVNVAAASVNNVEENEGFITEKTKTKRKKHKTGDGFSKAARKSAKNKALLKLMFGNLKEDEGLISNKHKSKIKKSKSAEGISKAGHKV